MNIKISRFKSTISSSKVTLENNNFLNLLNENLNEKLEEAEISDYNCDLKMLFIETGGTEGIFLSSFDKLQEPYYLLTNGSNNSLAASLEILTYLRLHNLKGEILHGDIIYLTNRIKELVTINNAKQILNNTKLGVIGKPSDWLISSIPDEVVLKEKLGIELVDIPLKQIEEASKKQAFIKDDSFTNSIFDKNEIGKALDIYSSIKKIVANKGLSGVTIRCFDLLSSLHSTGCLALSKLNDEGVIGCCEGDIMGMISMLVLKSIGVNEAFQANPSRIDTINNNIVLAHCTIPLKMTTEYKLDTHFESGIGVAIKGELKKEKVTIFRLSSNLKDYTIMTGNIIENLNEADLCRTQINVHLDTDVKELLKKPNGNHHIICYGDYSLLLKQLLSELF